MQSKYKEMGEANKFYGRPCAKCNEMLRYVKGWKECVACVKDRVMRYQQSPKGKLFHERYQKSPERKAVQKRYDRRYLQTPKGQAVHRVNIQRQKAKRKEVEGHYTAKEWLLLKESYGNLCLCCRRHEQELDGPLQQDHVIPISKGGTNWITNIQPLCRKCNGMSGKGVKCTDYRQVIQ